MVALAELHLLCIHTGSLTVAVYTLALCEHMRADCTVTSASCLDLTKVCAQLEQNEHQSDVATNPACDQFNI